MFRKTESNVPDGKDCHRDLQLHVSIAFDWLYLGHTKEGTRRETVWSLIASLKNRRNTGALLSKEEKNTPTKTIISLAQTELSLFYLEVDKPRLEALGPIIKAVITQQLQIIRHASLLADVQIAVSQTLNHDLESIRGLVRLVEDDDVDAVKHHEFGQVRPHATDFECACCGTELTNCYFKCDVSKR
jgi:hypothetical protein